MKERVKESERKIKIKFRVYKQFLYPTLNFLDPGLRKPLVLVKPRF